MQSKLNDDNKETQYQNINNKMIEPTLDSKDQLNNNHNDGLIINDKKWDGYNNLKLMTLEID